MSFMYFNLVSVFTYQLYVHLFCGQICYLNNSQENLGKICLKLGQSSCTGMKIIVQDDCGGPNPLSKVREAYLPTSS